MQTTFQVQYTQQIRHFVIELGLQDLTLPIFAQCRQALEEFMAKATSQTMVRSLPGGTVPLTAPYLGILWGMFVKARLHKIWVQKYALNHRFGPQPDEQYPLLKTPLLMTLRTNDRTVTVGRSELGACVMCKMPQEVQDLLNHAKVGPISRLFQVAAPSSPRSSLTLYCSADVLHAFTAGLGR